uniref:Uncharacterized protein n=1 Tax=mine drainage metagenome TaxID=410659 RepID=E6QRP5_9ZZZZ
MFRLNFSLACLLLLSLSKLLHDGGVVGQAEANKNDFKFQQ